jgi:phosphoglycerol transferase MdoB-like AlkP superfamily enzyme
MGKFRPPRLVCWVFSLGLLFFLIMSLLRVVHFYVFHPADATVGNSLAAFVLGARYDLRIIGLAMLVTLLLGSIPILHPYRATAQRRGWLIFLGFFSLVLILFYAFDFSYYAYLSQRLNASALNFLADAKISGSMVWQSYPVVKMSLAVIAALILLIWCCARLYRLFIHTPPVTRKNRVAWTVFTFLLFGLGVFGRVGQFPLRWSDAFALGNDYKANLSLNPLQSFFSSLSFRHSGFDIKKVTESYPLMAAYLGITQPDSNRLRYQRLIEPRSGAIKTRPNVVLVICESFSAYKSSMWGNPLKTTPFFEELCSNGIFFDRCFTPHFGTARGVWATITGVPDVQLNKTASRNPAAVNQHTIINDFKGYEKLYFLGGSTSWANIRGLLTNNIEGLRLYEEGSYTSPKIDVWGISDRSLFMEANKVLKQQTKPFFAVVQTADNHRPYTIPEADRGEFKLTNVSTELLKQYGFESNEEMNAFRFTDFCFSKFMEAAKQEAYFKNTVFVFVGDHGIRGNAGDMFPKAWTEQGLTCEHVPLLFYAPGLLPAARHSVTCSQIDILPTIAGLTGIPCRNSGLGRDLLNPQNDSSFANCAFIIDHDERQIGIIQQNQYFVKQLGTGRENFVSLLPGNTPPPDSLRNHYRRLTDAFYETSRYMLYHNKKP